MVGPGGMGRGTLSGDLAIGSGIVFHRVDRGSVEIKHDWHGYAPLISHASVVPMRRPFMTIAKRGSEAPEQQREPE